MFSGFSFKTEQVFERQLVAPDEVRAVKQWLHQKPYKIPDELVCHFLFACENDVENTLATIEKYVKARKSMLSFFSSRDLDGDLRESLDIS